MGIRLTPVGRLRWEPSPDEAAPGASPSLQGAFETDWREALFTLAAEKTPTRDTPSVRYWQQLAERHLTGLCHVPEDAESFEVEPPTSADCALWILTAPPMHGGEYLSEETLQRIWEGLDGWVREAVSRAGGLAAFLRERAPKWQQVGRVCFHLAENRNDEARPFAFMATYASGFGAAGRVKHLPLRKALEQYAGARNRAALVKLLSPVQRAAESCGWVKDLVDSGDVYRPMAWTAGQAWRLLRSAEDLEASGLSVSLPNWWRRRPRPQVSVTIGAGAPSRLDAGAMLDFDVRVALGDATLSREELDALLDGEGRPGAAQGPMGRGGPRPAAPGCRALECARTPGRRRRGLLRRGDATARRRAGGSPARGAARAMNATGCTSSPAAPCARSLTGPAPAGGAGCGGDRRCPAWHATPVPTRGTEPGCAS